MFFVKDDFLDNFLIADIFKNIEKKQPSKVYNKEGTIKEYKNIRASINLSINHTILNHVKKNLLELSLSLNDKFSIKTNSISKIDSLQYNKGHFFKPHRDTNPLNKNISNRALTAIIYLNNSSKYDQTLKSFDGGELILYEVNKKFPSHGFPIFPKKGRLVVFPSHLMHEVKEITRGFRFCMVAWYLHSV